MLAYLACASKPSQRAGLCELLWSDAPEPRAALRWCLSKLRPVLDAGGSPRLVAEDDSVWIPEETCEVDGKRLRGLARDCANAATEALEDAVARCSGPFLSDLDVADAFRFESWKASEEKALEQARATLFQELLRRYADKPEEAARAGHLWAQQDPFNPKPHIAVIEALTALGRRREALGHWARSDRMLRRDGGEAHAGLEKARAAIGRIGGTPERAEASRDVAGKSNMEVTMEADAGAAMAGRREEMDRFRGRLEGDAGPRMILLQGEPGIGKTRLLEEMERRLRAEGWISLRGRAFEAERGRALGPWIDAAWAAVAPGGEACPLLHPLAADEGRSETGILFAAVRDWMARLAGGGRLAVVLDDVHWLDPASVALLQFLIRDARSPVSLFLGGLRSVAAGSDSSVEAFLTAARREGWTGTWEIGPLSPQDTAELLRLSGSRRDPGQVFAQSAGHPLAALALAHDPADGEGQGARASLEAMLDERVRQAGEEGRGVLQWAALMGRGLSPALLEALSGLAVNPLLTALERLEVQGLVRVESGKAGLEYLFGHDLIRQRVHSGLSAPRRLRMHAHVAQVLRRNPSHARGWEEVAHHAESGEVWDLAAQACVEAAIHCNRLRAYEAALDHVMRGLSHLDRLAGQWDLLQSLCETASIAGASLGRFPDGMEGRMSHALQEARMAGKHEVALMAIAALANLQFVQNRHGELIEAARQTAETAGEGVDPAVRAYFLADMALCLILTDQDIPHARELTRKAQALQEEYGFPEGNTDGALGFFALRSGKYPEAERRVRSALDFWRGKQLLFIEHGITATLGQIHFEAGDYVKVLSVAECLRALSRDFMHRADGHFPEVLEALARRKLGDPQAESLCAAVLGKLRGFDCKVMTAYLLLQWAEMDLAADRFDRVAAYAQEALARTEPLKRMSEPAWARALMGLAALRQGDRAEAETAWAGCAAARNSLADLPITAARPLEALARGLDHPLTP